MELLEVAHLVGERFGSGDTRENSPCDSIDNDFLNKRARILVVCVIIIISTAIVGWAGKEGDVSGSLLPVWRNRDSGNARNKKRLYDFEEERNRKSK